MSGLRADGSEADIEPRRVNVGFVPDCVDKRFGEGN
jgi:hypothetical protein